MNDRTPTAPSRCRIGIDTGGTFTDVVAEDGAVTKVLSTPDDPAQAVAAGITGGMAIATSALAWWLWTRD